MQMSAPTDLVCDTPHLPYENALEAGISSSALSRAVKRGEIERIERGLYQLSGTELDENQSLSEVAARVPQGGIVLVSALKFHDIATHQAHAVWVLLKINAVTPGSTIRLSQSFAPVSLKA